MQNLGKIFHLWPWVSNQMFDLRLNLLKGKLETYKKKPKKKKVARAY